MYFVLMHTNRVSPNRQSTFAPQSRYTQQGEGEHQQQEQ